VSPSETAFGLPEDGRLQAARRSILAPATSETAALRDALFAGAVDGSWLPARSDERWLLDDETMRV
jgi:hypothetical protein